MLESLVTSVGGVSHGGEVGRLFGKFGGRVMSHHDGAGCGRLWPGGRVAAGIC